MQAEEELVKELEGVRGVTVVDGEVQVDLNNNEALVESLSEFEAQERSRGAMFLEHKDPHLAMAVLKGLSEGASHLSLHKKYGISRQAVGDLKKRHSMAIDEHRKLMRIGAAMAVDSSHDLLMRKHEQLRNDPAALAKTPLKDFAVGYAITFDKAQVTQDQPTSISRNEGGMTIEDMKAYHDKLIAEIPEVEVVDE